MSMMIQPEGTLQQCFTHRSPLSPLTPHPTHPPSDTYHSQDPVNTATPCPGPRDSPSQLPFRNLPPVRTCLLDSGTFLRCWCCGLLRCLPCCTLGQVLLVALALRVAAATRCMHAGVSATPAMHIPCQCARVHGMQGHAVQPCCMDAPAYAPGSCPHSGEESSKGGTRSDPGGCACSMGPWPGRLSPAPAFATALGGRSTATS